MSDETRAERLARLRADNWRPGGPKLTPLQPVPRGEAEAAYPGVCGLCGRGFRAGADIAFLDGRPVHGEHR